MSLAELTRRLSEVRAGEAHLKGELPVDNPHNAILRLKDIVAYTSIPAEYIRRLLPQMQRLDLPHAPRPKPKGKDKPADATLIAERQTLLSRFFYGWDHGTLIKTRVGDEWRICNRHQDALPLGGAPRAQAPAGKVITMRIDRETLGLRFK